MAHVPLSPAGIWHVSTLLASSDWNFGALNSTCQSHKKIRCDEKSTSSRSPATEVQPGSRSSQTRTPRWWLHESIAVWLHLRPGIEIPVIYKLPPHSLAFSSCCCRHAKSVTCTLCASNKRGPPQSKSALGCSAAHFVPTARATAFTKKRRFDACETQVSMLTRWWRCKILQNLHLTPLERQKQGQARETPSQRKCV